LTNYSEPNEEVVVIYAGSAPSNKLPFLADMFPNVKWILVDPNIHYLRFNTEEDQYSPNKMDELIYLKISPSYRTDKADIGQRNKESKRLNLFDSSSLNLTMMNKVERNNTRQGSIPDDFESILRLDHRFIIIEDVFTDELAQTLAKIPQKTLFISDIRTNPDKESPSTLDILWNSAMMYNWMKILKPFMFMIKFRCPFPPFDGVSYEEEYANLLKEYNERTYTHDDFAKCDIPFMDNFKNGIFEFIKGDILVQAFAPITSTESRLIANSLEIIKYDIVEYEEKFFYFNNRMRSQQIWRSYLSPEIGIDNCHDCALMCFIFEEYYDKFVSGDNKEKNKEKDNEKEKEREIKNMIKMLLKSINRSLFAGREHGELLKKEPKIWDGKIKKIY
jgi:hypothetical protein